MESNRVVPQQHPEGIFEAQLYEFLSENTRGWTSNIYYTEDWGLRGLQTYLSECDGTLKTLVMPEGDEVLSMWEAIARREQNSIRFLYRGKILNEFPVLTFWFETTISSVTKRLHIHDKDPGPIIAMSIPGKCEMYFSTIPFSKLSLTGGKE
ncbi:hypothetical protein NF212_08985 [Parasalinivibrio latis]|uniref:hypothetical protein n=1 Tax=Parasalinivibrio latis TaxID=2952610 RepID=UPI0030E1A807